jgi:hypothetical protein
MTVLKLNPPGTRRDPPMPRRLRIEFEGAIYHVMTRGNARQDIVYNDDDRGRLLADLERTVHRFAWQALALAIMRMVELSGLRVACAASLLGALRSVALGLAW